MDRNTVLKITSLWIVLSTLMSAFDLVNSAPFKPKTGKHIISSKSVLFMLEKSCYWVDYVLSKIEILVICF